ncbi:hypothetical protein Prudu_013811 [Prunus dulcis]|uniref:Uncharacterized protein n=1 Tax=Prunus dulcis TaxID=3755 RepID=A0A4Y1RFS0_PRUDU|nr:hypothetical protein Prudu_013811 [Prunus dulcis]
MGVHQTHCDPFSIKPIFVLLLKNSGHDESNWSFRACEVSWVAITISKTFAHKLVCICISHMQLHDDDAMQE